MDILNFNQFKMSESIGLYKQGDMKMTDSNGSANISVQLVDQGWGLDRRIIFNRFKVIKSDSDKYPIGAEFILPLDFNDKVCSFLIYPYYNEKRWRSMTEFQYKAHCQLIS